MKGLKDIARIGMLGGLIAVLRYALTFLGLGGFQPMTALIFLFAVGFGKRFGFYLGIVSALVSGLLTGVGTWTIFQCVAWGSVGLLGGCMRSFPKIKLYWLSVIGFLIAFPFGWFMNIEYWLLYTSPLKLSTYLASCAMSFTFDLTHALANLAFITILVVPVLKFVARLDNE